MIGDVLATSILFEAIKQKYPDSELHYVLNTHTYPVVEHHPFINHFHFFTPAHERSKFKLYKFAQQLRQEHFDVVIDVYSKLSSNVMVLLSGAKTKISIKKGQNAFVYSHRFKHKHKAKTNAGLAIENRLQLLQPLNIDINRIVKPKIYLTKTEIESAKQFLASHKINLSKPLFMIGVLGSSNEKTYPFKYMATIIDSVVKAEPDCQILFNYIPKQAEHAKAIYELCKPETQKQIYFQLFGKSLREFLAITWHCNALIGNEGGAINMAKALNKPTFTVFSPWIKKEAWNMFDDGSKHVSVHLKDFKHQHYDDVLHPKKLKSKASELYLDFKPSLFLTDLDNFLKRLS
tara:strand:- start:148241 stop:149281 length:1041 start_codon:yes stop_codon:yes gene_type:complete